MNESHFDLLLLYLLCGPPAFSRDRMQNTVYFVTPAPWPLAEHVILWLFMYDLGICLQNGITEYVSSVFVLVAGILHWHHLWLYNHSGHSLSSGESSWDQTCLSISLTLSLPSFVFSFKVVIYGWVWHQWWMSLNTALHWLQGPGSFVVLGLLFFLWSYRFAPLQ